MSRGYGAALNAAMITKESKVGIWGLGAVGLSAVMGAKERGAKTIIGIDINEAKFQKEGCAGVMPRRLGRVLHPGSSTHGQGDLHSALAAHRRPGLARMRLRSFTGGALRLSVAVMRRPSEEAPVRTEAP
ncbi:all-trans-retinol dehydrogenase [NAD(+)] ADH4-like [Amblyomma americanum]